MIHRNDSFNVFPQLIGCEEGGEHVLVAADGQQSRGAWLQSRLSHTREMITLCVSVMWTWLSRVSSEQVRRCRPGSESWGNIPAPLLGLIGVILSPRSPKMVWDLDVVLPPPQSKY
jgi:hypothetical protein